MAGPGTAGGRRATTSIVTETGVVESTSMQFKSFVQAVARALQNTSRRLTLESTSQADSRPPYVAAYRLHHEAAQAFN